MHKFNHLKAFLVCLLLAPAAQADVLTFDEGFFTHGTVVNSQYSPLVSISAQNIGGGPNLAVAFDSSLNNTRDGDLESPFNSNNPNLADNFNPGNILIIQENSVGCLDGICDLPDDEGSRPGGVIEFRFTKVIELLSMDFFDIETAENGSTLANRIRLFDTADAEILPNTFYTPDTGGDNLWDQILFNQGVTGVARIDVYMGGSGAIDNLVYNVVPVPAAVWLFGTALFGFFGFSKRKKAA
ncbi:PEP-CTERM sorting domain-containing protein [Gammaproteobacteria bacterium]|nr:PEP-CTERM sorting domain-containing protein [Gammaproteobacteria bacterium]